MRNAGSVFIATSAVFALVGMAWGIQMSASGNHMLSPAHGHLNLVGWATGAIFGLYYMVNPVASASRLAMPHYLLHLVAVLVLTPGIAMAISRAGETLAKVGSVLTLLSMLVFIVVVFRSGFRQPA